MRRLLSASEGPEEREIELAGRPIGTIQGERFAALAHTLDQVYRSGQAMAVDEPLGTEGRCHLLHQPVRGADGQVGGVLVIGAQSCERRAEAERRSRTKDEFIARVSHELSTPLSAMKMWIRLLKLGRPRHYQTAVAALEQCAAQQTKIIEDLLDISRSLSGKLRLDLKPVDLGHVVRSAVTAIEPEAHERRLQIRVRGAEQPVIVLGDEARLRQVALSLLSNAMKFTPPGGQIEVRLEGDHELAHLSISDNGRGIDEAFLPYLFEPFQQAYEGPELRSGLGLGLAIVHQLVTQHGGTVVARSPGQGQGATFTVTLVRTAEGTRQEGGRQGERREARDRLRGMHLLLVERDEQTRQGMALLLTRYGARVRAAAHMDEALRLLRESPPQVILCDLSLAGDGLEFVRRVREIQEATPMVALVGGGRSGAEERERARKAGFHAYVSKPVEPDALLEVLASFRGRDTTEEPEEKD
jgi:signal transduction histidine kinase/ActR/RegA family two-component response regulator